MVRKQRCERCAELEAQIRITTLMLAAILGRLGGSVEITPYEMIRTRRATLRVSRSDDVVVGGANIVLRRDFFGIEDTIEVAQ